MIRAPVFLARASYRQRRLRDALRALPVLGGVLCLVPLLWAQDGPDPQRTATAIVYLFAVWSVLIVLAAILSQLVRSDPAPDGAEDG